MTNWGALLMQTHTQTHSLSADITRLSLCLAKCVYYSSNTGIFEI